jgi:hypothetical protein
MRTGWHDDLMLDRAATLEEILMAISFESDPGMASANQSVYICEMAPGIAQYSRTLGFDLELYDELNLMPDRPLN